MPEFATPWSLQTRVELITAVALCIGLAIGSVTMFQAAAVEDDQVIDERVERIAKRILNSVEAGMADHAELQPIETRVVASGRPEMGLHGYQIWLDGGNRLFRSHNTPWDGPILPVEYSGYREVTHNGIRYCAYSAASTDRRFVIQVSEPTPNRTVEIRRLSGRYLVYLVLPFVLLFAIARWLLGKSFQPLEVMSKDLRQRGPNDVSELRIDNPPKEVAPLVTSLNAHFHRLGHTLSVEQRFTSVAAHELRTPLAGIRAQAQLAARAEDAGDLRDALAAVMRGVDSASRVIDQLIDLHHVDSVDSDIETRGVLVDFRQVFQQVVEELDNKARKQNTVLTGSFEVTHVPGIEFAIFVLLRNLVANALLYGKAGGKVKVSTTRHGEEVHLTVDDDGPGIPEEARQVAFQKFHRLGKQNGDGIGLGLSIVAQVARLHGAKIALLDAPGGGLRVLVRFRLVR